MAYPRSVEVTYGQHNSWGAVKVCPTSKEAQKDSCTELYRWITVSVSTGAFNQFPNIFPHPFLSLFAF